MSWLNSLQGARPLFIKEVMRFWKVSFQTIGAPVLTAVLYLLIFGHVLEDHVQVFKGFPEAILDHGVHNFSMSQPHALAGGR